MRVYIINDEQLLEGVIGSLIMPLLIAFFRFTEGITFIYSSILAFLLTWIARKVAINNYIIYKRKYGIKVYNYELEI